MTIHFSVPSTTPGGTYEFELRDDGTLRMVAAGGRGGDAMVPTSASRPPPVGSVGSASGGSGAYGWTDSFARFGSSICQGSGGSGGDAKVSPVQPGETVTIDVAALDGTRSTRTIQRGTKPAPALAMSPDATMALRRWAVEQAVVLHAGLGAGLVTRSAKEFEAFVLKGLDK